MGEKVGMTFRKRYLLVVVLLVVVLILFLKTGTFNPWGIDDRDLAAWDYVDGVIVGGESFELNSSYNVCWMVIHGYTDSPDSMRGIAGRINEEFGDYVYAPRLLGHAEVPSHLLNYTLEDWYAQVSGDLDGLEERCGKVNVVGFSFGGALSLRLAEERDLNNVYLIAPYLEPTYRWNYILPLSVYLNLFSDVFNYVKKSRVAKVNSLEWPRDYIGYFNFAFVPVKNSYDFLEMTKGDVYKVEESILIQHSRGDDTASFEMSELIYDGVSSEVKDIVLYNKSNHVILEDYDGVDVIDRILEFERESRDRG